MSDLLEKLYEKTSKANVDILSVFNDNGVYSFGGSGFFIRNDGYIFTAAHVVFDLSNNKLQAENIYVTYFRENKAEVIEAFIIGWNFVTDFAILKVNVTGNKFLEWGKSEQSNEGELIYTIGNPSGNNPLSISSGVIRDTHFHDENLVSNYVLLYYYC